MARKLDDANRAAIDLLLDRTQAEANSGSGDRVVVMTGAVPEQRLSAVQRILSMLDHMPAPEPSSDLVVRTLQRVGRVAETMTAPAPGASGYTDPTQPLA
jgi:hypothetical protein